MIAHPPCTYLCSSGMHCTTRGIRDPQLTDDAVDFVRKLMNADIHKIAIENPVGCISTRIRKADQYVHPWQFGDDASKKTGWWLKGLPKLVATDIVAPRIIDGKERWANQCDSGQNKLGPSDDRWKERSKTYPGMAMAIAEQWASDTGWRRVSFAADCTQSSEWEDTDELGDICSLCGLDYCEECRCPGHTEEGWEYETFHGVLMARRDAENNRK